MPSSHDSQITRTFGERFPWVDVLRGIAALLVVFYHVLALKGWADYPSTGLARLPQWGWIGVDLFFVISGFVICNAAMRAQSTGSSWRGYFAERRMRRIAPLYLATTALYLLLVNPSVLRQGWASVYQIGMHLGFVHNLWHETHGSINPPSWSVGLEMQFYALMALCTPWLARTALWKVVAVWTGVAIAWRYGAAIALPAGKTPLIMQFIYTTQLPGVLDEFVCGICIARLVQSQALRFTWTRLISWSAVALLTLTLASQVLLSLESIVPPTGEMGWSAIATLVLWRTLLCAGFAALLACLVMIPVAGGWLTQPFRYMGKISYGIYLWHMPILLTLLDTTTWRGSQLLGATVACTLVMASMSWHGFERLWLTDRHPSVPQ